ncbi:NAD(P)/FAD-dependent oxidoreductase [Flavobacterium sp. I3-2]|uniref:NAD(P)/FAD-dependent oxidoreductase n=1 Tax=Flavobacterium sp. I3-2 TaxID=2748319 RepID=UPI0015A893DF|nr:FAD-dependent oxidoreductase [Flavobacterium sp. I3-2]
MTDYLIVGGGIAGLCFADFCLKHNKSFAMIDDKTRTSSKVAGGMFNPVVLKRFTSIWKSDEQLALAMPFYKNIESDLKTKFLYEIPIFRKFASVEEQNNWFHSCDQPSLSHFLKDKISKVKINHISSDFGFGEVYQTGFLDVNHFVTSYQNFLFNLNLLSFETFHYDAIEFENDSVIYNGNSYKNIIFAEGFSMLNNPYFNNLPLDGTKGELLIVRIPDLNLDKIVKSGIFIIPFKDDLYKVGATYNWQDKSDVQTQEAKNELLEGLSDLIDCDFEVVEHLAGIRPTVKDRRPLIGTHYKHKQLHLLNGLGTRGVLLGPYLSDLLFLKIEFEIPLDQNVDINRYYKKMQLK